MSGPQRQRAEAKRQKGKKKKKKDKGKHEKPAESTFAIRWPQLQGPPVTPSPQPPLTPYMSWAPSAGKDSERFQGTGLAKNTSPNPNALHQVMSYGCQRRWMFADEKVSHMKKHKSPLITVGTQLEGHRPEDWEQQSESVWQWDRTGPNQTRSGRVHSQNTLSKASSVALLAGPQGS